MPAAADMTKRCPSPKRPPGRPPARAVLIDGKWQTPDGGAAGLNLQATDLQVLRAYEPECPF